MRRASRWRLAAGTPDRVPNLQGWLAGQGEADEAPKVDAPKADAPKIEAAKADAPKIEMPRSRTRRARPARS